MSQGVLDLIQAIDSGDSVAIESAFNAEMAARVSDRLETMRTDVAKNMFSEASCGSKKKMSEEECDDEEDEDEDKKEMKESTEITFTAEELEELKAYIQSEEFAKLTEEEQQVLLKIIE